MSELPETSVTLLNALGDTSSGRWSEFFKIYEGPMRAYLAERFPTLEADDIVQLTMMALMEKLPDYRYAPDERGHFRNYLIGIVRHKAQDALRRRVAESEKRKRALAEPAPRARDDAWMVSVQEVALAQLFADTSVSRRNLEVFRHVALLHEPPESVAAAFGISRGNVDVIKKRMIERLAALVRRLMAVG